MKFRCWTAVRFSLEVEVEADDMEDARRKIKAMDAGDLIAEAGDPEIEVEDFVEDR